MYEAVFTPITTGKVSFMAQAFAIVNHAVPVPGAAIDRYGGPGAALAPRSFSNQQLLLDSEPFEVEVQPLPSKGQLPGFTGAIGSLALGPVSVSTNEAQVGETLKLTVKVFGDTNTSLNRLVAPPPLRVPEWQMFPAVSDNLPPQPPGSMAPGPDKSSFVSFNYTLIPLSEKATNTPAIPFSYFDMHRNAYADITIPSVPLIVHPGASPADLQALLQPASSDTNTEKEPVLSGLATSPGLASGSLVPIQRQFWFPLMQILPAAGFVGLWTWERRRRYLEQHPEVILRRRARRAMRRQWRLARRAAAARDSGRFAAAAVNAMRAACAPHYPAEAGALVGSDVLGVLAERDRVGHVGDVIRRFFATTDACSFATNPPETSQLLGLRADLESLLEKLEEKL
ncbi:MAG: hypothetical protein C5B50_19640 [Verrucomicrobia bacterium]|nr:MAG: hypothetical protein C5B50_19640 [Verrucomicrobiota bacterium]